MDQAPNIYLLQATRKHFELAQAFQDDMGAYFFEHTMYDVKDALSSILAICDIAEMEELPEIKGYIQRVTDLIGDVSLYHDNNVFNVKHVLLNVIKMLEKSYKGRIDLSQQISSIKAQAKGDQHHLEKVLLYAMLEAIESSPIDKEIDLNVSLSQRERDALMNIRIENFSYSSVARKEVLNFSNQKGLKTHILSEDDATVVSIHVPLSFATRASSRKNEDKSLSLSLDELRRAPSKPVLKSDKRKSKKADLFKAL